MTLFGKEEVIASDEIDVDAVLEFRVIQYMAGILTTMLAILVGLVLVQTPSTTSESSFLADPRTQPSKRAYEMFVATYTPVWIAAFGCIVVFQLYEQFTAWTYLWVCGGLALPFLLQPILLPSALYDSPDAARPLSERYAFKANLWLAIFSFIGNYWYTHYFYSVLNAKYTMPSHRLNDVPIAMYFATHFYFSSYHFFSNALLRKVVSTYEPSIRRTVLFAGVVLAFAYFTAFMETLTISSYPYYTFEDKFTAYTIGSAFYGIYFLVSFPGFFAFDDDVDQCDGSSSRVPKKKGGAKVHKHVSVWDTVLSACGHGMLILTLLDLVRLYLGIALIVQGW